MYARLWITTLINGMDNTPLSLALLGIIGAIEDTHIILSDVIIRLQGQLLPPPLCYCSQILHLLTPHDFYLIMMNVWRFMQVSIAPEWF